MPSRPKFEEFRLLDEKPDHRELESSAKRAKIKKSRKKKQRVFLAPSIEVPAELLVAQQWIVDNVFKGKKNWAAAHDAPKKRTDKHGLENIVGIEIGQKRSKAGPTAQLCVVVKVLRKPKTKAEEARFRKEFLIPKSVKIGKHQVYTDIQVGRRFRPHVNAGDPCGLNRATPQGFEQGSIGFFCTAIFQDQPHGFILTASHVIGDFLNLTDGAPNYGEEVQFPVGPGQTVIGFYYMSGGDDIDGALAFGKTGAVDLHQHEGFDVVPTAVDDLTQAFSGTRVKIYSHRAVEQGLEGVREGIAGPTGINTIPYESGTRQMSSTFTIQSDTGEPFSFPGDSGAGIVDAATGVPVGLLLGGDGNTSLAQHIGPICDALRIVKILG
jgi:hypothetical protein